MGKRRFDSDSRPKNRKVVKGHDQGDHLRYHHPRDQVLVPPHGHKLNREDVYGEDGEQPYPLPQSGQALEAEMVVG